MKDSLLNLAIFLTIAAWLGGGVFVVYGLWDNEEKLENPRKINDIAVGMENGAISIVQPALDQPLKAEFNRNLYPQTITDKEWEQLQVTINKLVAASNWGLGSPFKYQTSANSGGRNVIAFNTDEFRYFNPFRQQAVSSSPVTIKYSSEIVRNRVGWRVISPNFSLFLKADAVQNQLEVNPDGSTEGGLPLVAKSFLLRSGGAVALRLSVLPSVKVTEGKSGSLTLGAEVLNGDKQTGAPRRYSNGQSFYWQGQPFVVNEAVSALSSDGQTQQQNTALSASDNLILNKRINGRPTRVNALGKSTMNLIGAQVSGGRPRLLDGAIKSEQVTEVRLTLDPDLQYESFRLLKIALEEIDGKAGIGRQRRGSVAILNAENGAIQSLAGYPSIDPSWLDRRRVLVDREGFTQNPAFDKQMPGSAVKVLTVGLGFLLYGSAQADLLPMSDNQKAVRQAFQDAYGKNLEAPLIGHEAELTDEAKNEFANVGGISNLRSDCTLLLEEAFGVLPFINNQTENHDVVREKIISDKLKDYFDAERLKEISPPKSCLPFKDANSMARLRHYAIGGEDARFSMLRLAAVLGTAGKGKKYEPFLVESVRDKSGNLIEENHNGAVQLNLSTQDGNRNIPKMTYEMSQYLGKVLIPGGTGSFFIEQGNGSRKHFLRLDDPLTPGIDESKQRENDYGKSGTASNEGKNVEPDSIFVYSHGKYLIAVWLEQSDFEGKNANLRDWRDNPAHKIIHRIVQLIENLEYQSNP